MFQGFSGRISRQKSKENFEKSNEYDTLSGEYDTLSGIKSFCDSIIKSVAVA